MGMRRRRFGCDDDYLQTRGSLHRTALDDVVYLLQRLDSVNRRHVVCGVSNLFKPMDVARTGRKSQHKHSARAQAAFMGSVMVRLCRGRRRDGAAKNLGARRREPAASARCSSSLSAPRSAVRKNRSSKSITSPRPASCGKVLEQSVGGLRVLTPPRGRRSSAVSPPAARGAEWLMADPHVS
jgi:hypothetical protein